MTKSWENVAEEIGDERLSKLIGTLASDSRDSAAEMMQNLPELPDAGASGQGVRWARVLELRAEIEAGTYWVSADDIAKSLIRFAQRHHSATSGMYPA